MTRHAAALLALCLLMNFGCTSTTGPPTAKVSGKVTYKGEGLKGGQVIFFQAARPYGADIKSDGTYSTMAGVGTCQVVINYREPDLPDPKAPTSGMIVPGKSRVPEKYASEHTTPLKFEIKPGTNEANFDLE